MIDNENQDQFDQPAEFEDGGDGERKGGQLKSNVAEAWRTRPIFKLLVLMIAVGALIAALIGFLSPKPEVGASRIGNVPVIVEAPGGKATPAFIEAQQKANQQRIQEEVQVGGSALPTPLPSGISIESRKDQADPLVQFRAELEKQKEEQRKQIQSLQQQNTQQQQLTVQQDQQIQDKLAQVMQAQMGQLFELWKPKGMSAVSGMDEDNKSHANAAGSASRVSGSGINSGTTGAKNIPPLIAAGTVNYAQLLTAANSDAKAPILAQILTGPLAGARALGKFKVEQEFMVLEFNLATLKGKEYKISAFAIDPDTTLPALATNVDHRYFARVILPAAASFVSELGKTLGQKPTNSTVTTGGVIITEQAQTGIKDGLYAGMGAAGESIASFLKSEANNTKVLVEVGVGTPMGFLFTESVCAGEFPCTAATAHDEPGGDEKIAEFGAAINRLNAITQSFQAPNALAQSAGGASAAAYTPPPYNLQPSGAYPGATGGRYGYPYPGMR